jgi:acrylyl-CoA reductase (NADPH)
MKHRGVLAACGLAGGMDFPATVAPFILRGVTLAGIDRVHCPVGERREAWRRLGATWTPPSSSDHPAGAARGCSHVAEQLIAGTVRGRVVVQIPDN